MTKSLNMQKRPLTDVEKDLTNKNVELMKKENKLASFDLAKLEIKLKFWEVSESMYRENHITKYKEKIEEELKDQKEVLTLKESYEREMFHYDLEHFDVYTLKIEEQIKIEKKKVEAGINALKSRIEENDKIIAICVDQIENGVEPKIKAGGN